VLGQATSEAEQSLKRRRMLLSAVMAKCKLIQVTLQPIGARAVGRADEPLLEVADVIGDIHDRSLSRETEVWPHHSVPIGSTNSIEYLRPNTWYQLCSGILLLAEQKWADEWVGRLCVRRSRATQLLVLKRISTVFAPTLKPFVR
jgi:hypothetical protein